MHEFSFECPHCGTLNTIVEYGVAFSEPVNCSRCRKSVGNLHELDGTPPARAARWLEELLPQRRALPKDRHLKKWDDGELVE